MPQIINSFRQTENPLAKVVSTIGNTMFGDTLTPALNRQKLRAAERENIGIEELARTFGGAADGTVSPNAVSELAILAGMKPEDLAAHNVFLTGNKLGPRNAATTNAMAGAGKYKDSAENLDLDRGNAFAMNAADNVQLGANNAADNAQKSWEFLVKPVDAMVNGQPGFVQQGAAAGLGNTGGYADKVVGAESGGDPLAKNPNSTATGAGQFLDSTWLDMMARHAPEFTQGKTPEQILALRNDPTLSRTMTEYFGQENAQTLQSAGLPVTDGTKYLAHFAGAGGATKVLQAPPGTPVSAVLSPEAMAANPFLQGMTTDQLAQWANSKVGGAPSIAPIPQKPEKTVEMIFQENLRAADMAMPGATPEQKRQWALQQISKANSQGITVSPDGTIQVGGSGPRKLTEAEMKGLSLFSALESSVNDLAKGGTADNMFPGYDKLAGWRNAPAVSVGGLPFASEAAGRPYMSGEGQVAFDALRNITQNYLYSNSGATAPDAEVLRNMQMVLPTVSDGPEAIAAKKARLANWLQAIRSKVPAEQMPEWAKTSPVFGGAIPSSPAPAAAPGGSEEEWTIGPDGRPTRVK